MNLQVVYVINNFYDLFFTFSILKEHKLHMHLGPTHLFIEFLKFTKFVTNLIFSVSEFHM